MLLGVNFTPNYASKHSHKCALPGRHGWRKEERGWRVPRCNSDVELGLGRSPSLVQGTPVLSLIAWQLILTYYSRTIKMHWNCLGDNYADHLVEFFDPAWLFLRGVVSEVYHRTKFYCSFTGFDWNFLSIRLFLKPIGICRGIQKCEKVKNYFTKSSSSATLASYFHRVFVNLEIIMSKLYPKILTICFKESFYARAY